MCVEVPCAQMNMGGGGFKGLGFLKVSGHIERREMGGDVELAMVSAWESRPRRVSGLTG